MEPIQSLMPSALARLVRPAPLSPEKVAFAWRAAVGPAVSRATRVRFAGLFGVLEVVVDDDRFGDELERSASLVLTRLQAMLGDDAIGRLDIKRPGRPPARRRRTGARPQAGKVKGEK